MAKDTKKWTESFIMAFITPKLDQTDGLYVWDFAGVSNFPITI